jgi:hypothetical protein
MVCNIYSCRRHKCNIYNCNKPFDVSVFCDHTASQHVRHIRSYTEGPFDQQWPRLTSRLTNANKREGAVRCEQLPQKKERGLGIDTAHRQAAENKKLRCRNTYVSHEDPKLQSTLASCSESKTSKRLGFACALHEECCWCFTASSATQKLPFSSFSRTSSFIPGNLASTPRHTCPRPHIVST